MKPVINIDDLDRYQEHDNGPYKERYCGISEIIGAVKLGYSVTVLPPGKKACPFHNHRVAEEMFLILEGTGTLRFGEQSYPLKALDVIACPPGGKDVAHQIINTGETPLKYFCLGTNENADICEYPDSNKIMCVSGRMGERDLSFIAHADQTADYFDGEL